jgi:hypothetical protein
MNIPSVKSFDALRKLKLKVKSDDHVQLTKSGGMFKARFHGHANFVFGATPEDAKQRLLSVIAKKWGIATVPISNLEKQLLEACR